MRTPLIDALILLALSALGAACDLETAREITVTDQRGGGICMVSQYSADTAAYARLAVANQRAYAARHGITYRYYVGRISGDAFVDPARGDADSLFGGGLYWQKVTAVQAMLAERVPGPGADDVPLCDWVLWLDSDILITRPERPLAAIIAAYAAQADGPDRDVIISREEAMVAVPVNSGAFFVRNNAVGRSYMDAVAAAYPAYRDHRLPDQDAVRDVAMQLLPWPGAEAWATGEPGTLHPRVALAPQRAFNSFLRPTYRDPAAAVWQPGDFAAHISGMRPEQRLAVMQWLIARLVGG